MYYTDSIEVFICLICFDDSKNCYTRQLTNYSIYICSYIYKLSLWGNVLFWQAPAGAVNINYSFFYIFWKYIIQNKAVNSANPFVVACLHVVRIIIFQQIIVINEHKIYYYFVYCRRKTLYWLSIWYYITNMNITKSYSSTFHISRYWNDLPIYNCLFTNFCDSIMKQFDFWTYLY